MLSDIRKARPGGNQALVTALRTGQRTASWWGSGLSALGLDSIPGAPVTAEQMAAVFGRLRYPDSDQSIGRAPYNYRQPVDPPPAAEPDPGSGGTRPERSGGGQRPMAAVAYYSFSFAPVKSVSVLYAGWLAAGRDDDAAQLRACHEQAIEIALGWGEPHLAVSRTHGGRGVARFAAGVGLTCALTPTVLSTAGDPHLNTLVMVLNRIALPEGRIGALWARSIGLTARGMSAAYDRALEQLATETLGLAWTVRTPRHREVTGVPPSLLDAASRRSSAIHDQHRDMLERYHTRTNQPVGEILSARMLQSASRLTLPAHLDAPSTIPSRPPTGPTTGSPSGPTSGGPDEPVATATADPRPAAALAALSPWIADHHCDLTAAVDAVDAVAPPPAPPALEPAELDHRVRTALAGPIAARSGVVSSRSGRQALGALMVTAAAAIDPATELGVPAAHWPGTLETVVRRVSPVEIEEPPTLR